MADYEPKYPPGVTVVHTALKKIMDEMVPKLHEVLQAAYRREADRRFDQFVSDACEEAAKPREQYKDPGDSHHWSQGYWSYVVGPTEKQKDAYHKKTGEYWPHHLNWATVCKFPQFFKITYSSADAKAKAALENARESFVGKNIVKFQSVLGELNVENVDININWTSGVFEGSVKVKMDDAEILASVGLKYVLRTVPNVTPYYQYPLLFRQVTVKGVKKLAPSEDEVRTLLGGGPRKTEEQIKEEKGLCPGSGKSPTEDDEVYKRSRGRMSTYGKCPVCGEVVSVQHYKYRAHKTKAAQRSELLAKGFCEMSDQPIPPEVATAAIEAAVKKDTYYGGRFIREKPFDSYEVRFPCTMCKWKGGSGSSRTGIYKQHKTKT